MLYCKHCKVNIRGNRKYCPLCQNALHGNGIEEEEIVPIIPETYQNTLMMRVMIFISISIIAISLAINTMFPVDFNWPMFIISGILCLWVSLALVIHKRHNIPKSITWQVVIISILAVIWDLRTGWIGWSLEFVIPIVCMVAMIVMYVTAKIMRLGVREFIVYLLLDAIFGIIPIIFIVLKVVNIVYPSILCVTISALSLSAILLFEGENIKDELNKRMHV